MYLYVCSCSHVALPSPPPPHQVAGGEAPHLESQPIQIASTPIPIGIVVDEPIAQPASTPIPTSLVINDPTTQPALGPPAGEGK